MVDYVWYCMNFYPVRKMYEQIQEDCVEAGAVWEETALAIMNKKVNGV